jgi:hypothetical protein
MNGLYPQAGQNVRHGLFISRAIGEPETFRQTVGTAN